MLHRYGMNTYIVHCLNTSNILIIRLPLTGASQITQIIISDIAKKLVVENGVNIKTSNMESNLPLIFANGKLCSLDIMSLVSFYTKYI